MQQIFDLSLVHPSWQECLRLSLNKMESAYLENLKYTHWLPGPTKIFNAFSLPLDKVNYVLFGESPYPRKESANGYAFWDASVKELWSPKGLSKQVNRATSLRNILKMLLVAEGLLDQRNCSQEAISKIDKQALIQSNQEFFSNLLKHGFLLLNTTLVLQEQLSPQKDAKAWLPFMQELMKYLLQKNSQVKIILLGRIANTVDKLISHPHLEKLYAEHPYNLSFITNQTILDFFRPFRLLYPESRTA